MDEVIKPENYITIQGWMITNLDLSGRELILYALIYGFSQGDGDGYTGSLKYLTEWSGSTKRNVMTVLSSLVNKGLVTKYEETKSGVKFCRYVTNFTSGEKTSPPPSEIISPGGEKISPNNNNYNNTNIKDIRKTVSISHKNPSFDYSNEFESIWSKYPKKQGKADALKSFTKARADGVSLEAISDGLDQYLFYIERTGTDTKYIKNGSTWFHQRCWEDDYTITERQGDVRNMTKSEQVAKDLQDTYDRLAQWAQRGETIDERSIFGFGSGD